MAKRSGKGKKGKGKGKKGKGKRGKKGQIPLKVLEKRLGRLNTIVKSRGGDAYV